MKNTARIIARYLAEHPQCLSYQQAAELSECRRASAELVDAALTKAGFTFVRKDGDRILTNALVSPDWCTGGITGGNCFSGQPNQPVDGEERPAWLETFVEQIAPELSFLKFRRLQQKCIDLAYTHNEYYGNRTHHACQVIRIKDLLEVLGA